MKNEKIIAFDFWFQIQSQKSAFESTCKPIMSKPKPKVEPPPPAPAAESDKAKDGSSKDDVDMKDQVNGGADASAAKDPPSAAAAGAKDTNMDVD